MATVATNAASLPGRLIRFFARYPPQQYSAQMTGQIIPTLRQRKETDEKPLSATSVPQVVLPPSEQESPQHATNSESEPNPPSALKQHPPNPFLPWKNPATGRWRGAKLGLRIQADLFKLARSHGVEELLPPSIKSSDYKQRRALERGLQVKGTGEGQSVKGHKWERQIATTMEKRRKAMEEMPEMIRLWKQRGHGRGWKKYPK